MILHKILFFVLVSEQLRSEDLINKLRGISFNSQLIAGLKSEKLEWGNSEQLNSILERHPEGFDLVLGADIYILICSIHLLLAACDIHVFKWLTCQTVKK